MVVLNQEMFMFQYTLDKDGAHVKYKMLNALLLLLRQHGLLNFFLVLNNDEMK